MASGAQHLTEHVGVIHAEVGGSPPTVGGRSGFVIAGIKELKSAQVGDTITLLDNPASEPLAGFKKVQSQVFAGLYPIESHDLNRCAMRWTKLQLNDAALQIRTRGEPGAWIWFSLRFSRPAAHGYRAGAARTRIQHGSHYHRANGGV